MRHPWLALILLVAIVLLGFFAWFYTGALRGNLAARLDLAHGRRKVLVYGLLGPVHPIYARFLQEHYGIQSEIVAGCVIWEPLSSYATAYNAVVDAAMKRQFGRDIFRDTLVEAVAELRASK